MLDKPVDEIVYDANGKQVYSNENVSMINNKLQIDLSNQSNGMYFIKVSAPGYNASKAFSIQK